MNVTLIQTELFWEDIEANMNHFSTLINEVNELTDIIILPEMFATGFTMNAEKYFEIMDGKIVNWMKEKSIEKNAAICGSLIIKESNKYYNRFVFVCPDGAIFTYDKKHLFRMGEEHNQFSSGTQQIIIDYKGFKILPTVCYDIRFPVWLRRTKKINYDMMIVVANWPERRAEHWKTLLQARAIENQSYVIGVNRIGNDGNGIYHAGDSSVINAKGEIIFQQTHQSFAKTVNINLDELTTWRNTFPVIEDADSFTFE